MLNLFCKGDQVIIRSRRRLLVKSGDTAGIDVGDEAPVVTRTSDSEQPPKGNAESIRQEAR